LLNIAQIDVEVDGPEHDVQGNINRAHMLFHNMSYSLAFTFCNMLSTALDVKQGKFLEAKSLFHQCLESTWGKVMQATTYCVRK
jgi:hypothetical protein